MHDVQRPSALARQAGERTRNAGQRGQQIGQDHSRHGDHDFSVGIGAADPADAMTEAPYHRRSDREPAHEAGEHQTRRPHTAAEHQAGAVETRRSRRSGRRLSRHEARERQPARVARCGVRISRHTDSPSGVHDALTSSGSKPGRILADLIAGRGAPADWRPHDRSGGIDRSEPRRVTPE